MYKKKCLKIIIQNQIAKVNRDTMFSTTLLKMYTVVLYYAPLLCLVEYLYSALAFLYSFPDSHFIVRHFHFLNRWRAAKDRREDVLVTILPISVLCEFLHHCYPKLTVAASWSSLSSLLCFAGCCPPRCLLSFCGLLRR